MQPGSADNDPLHTVMIVSTTLQYLVRLGLIDRPLLIRSVTIAVNCMAFAR